MMAPDVSEEIREKTLVSRFASRDLHPKMKCFVPRIILRKEVIQPQVPLRLPCYDFTPVADPTVAGCLLAVSAPSSGKTNSHGVTGGVYKARERIHRSVLICDYYRFQLHALELQSAIRTETAFC